VMRRRLLNVARAVRRRIQPLLPPLAANGVPHTLSRSRYEARGWIASAPHDSGWNVESVAAGQEAHWPVLLRNLEGPGPLGVSHFPDRMTRDNTADHNVMMSYGYVLARAARRTQRLSILDWGGSLGHYYLYSQALLPEVEIEYHCYEVPVLCQAGKRLQPSAHFHEGTDTLAGARFDLVINSAALHLVEDWREVARTLAQRTRGFLYVTRLQIVQRVRSFVVAHRSSYYGTEYQSWFLNRGEVLDCLEGLGMELVREFVFGVDQIVKDAPEQSECRGFLFRARE
jgi:putative methyltransferase (TIGR04325 family)